MNLFVFFGSFRHSECARACRPRAAMTASRCTGRRRSHHPSLMFLLVVALLGARIAAGNDGAATVCPMNETEPAPADARLVDGVLWAGRPERSYGPSAYRRDRDGGYVLCTCGESTKPCVRKCCKREKVYVKQNDGSVKCAIPGGSVEAIGNFTVPKFVNATGAFGSYEEDRFRLVYRKLTCLNVTSEKHRLEPSKRDQDNFRVSETGWLLNELGSAIAPPDQFCLEQFSDIDFQISAIVCSSYIENDEISLKNVLSTVGMLLSLPFLLITFLVYAFIRELRNLHGKSLMCHVATLLVAYTSLVVNKFTTNAINYDELCITLAFIMQFSFIASFFWLNIMCFDLWWTFSRFRPSRRNSNEYESKKFCYYSIYAWGCTSFISIFTYCKQIWPDFLSSVVSPEFGIARCWFSSDFALVLYFYGPVGVLLLSNLLMFIYTAVMIVKQMKDAKVLNRRDSQKNINHEKQRFVLYLKLFIVMGVNWLAEIVSWAIGSEVTSDLIWYVSDITNALQGVLIFVIFVCKKRVLILLNKKFNLGFHFQNTSNTESTRTTNSTVSRTSSSKAKDVTEINSMKTQNLTDNQLLQDVEV